MDIVPTTVAITDRPKKGKKVSANEFFLEFDVTVDKDGCFAIKIELVEDDPAYDDIILDNTDAFIATNCFTAGTKKTFRITARDPAPAGSTAPTAPATGTTTLPPLDGKWPLSDGLFDTDIELSFDIKVYYIGPCSATNTCEPTAVGALDNPYMHHHSTPVDRTLTGTIRTVQTASLELPQDELAAMASLPATFTGSSYGNFRSGSATLSALSVPVSIGPPSMAVVSNKYVEYQMATVLDQDSFDEPAVFVRRYALKGDDKHLVAEFFVKNFFTDLEDLGQTLLAIEDAVAQGDPKKAAGPSTAIVRHGRMTVFGEMGPRSGYFVHDRFNGLWFDGIPGTLPLTSILFATGGPSASAASVQKSIRETVWMTDEWWVYPLAWILAGPDYMDDMKELCTDILDPIIARNDCLEYLQIFSHGGALVSSSGSGTVVGSRIKMGSDYLSTDDFDANGKVTAGSKTEALLDKLKTALCPGAKVVFSACGQGVGDLLRNISKHIGNNVIINGNSDLGIPEIEGNMSFKNGQKV
ncbi:MAG: hypothetical protein V7701_17115 [Sneathiella sp.]